MFLYPFNMLVGLTTQKTNTSNLSATIIGIAIASFQAIA